VPCCGDQRYPVCNSHADLVGWFWSNSQAAPRLAPSGASDSPPSLSSSPSLGYSKRSLPPYRNNLPLLVSTQTRSNGTRSACCVTGTCQFFPSADVIIFTTPHSQAQRQGGPQSSNATGEYEMAGLQSPDRVTDGNGANAADGMTRFYNQVRSRPIFRYFILCKAS
jgi:hypothetical protein